MHSLCPLPLSFQVLHHVIFILIFALLLLLFSLALLSARCCQRLALAARLSISFST